MTPWRAFKQFFEEIHRKSDASSSSNIDESPARHRWQVLRSLACLGHIDLRFTTGDIQVVAAPPTLALLPMLRSYSAILCGARSPRLVTELCQVAESVGLEVSVCSQLAANPYAPSRIEVHGGDIANIKAVADRMGIDFKDVSPSHILASRATSLQQYIKELTWSDIRELNWLREDYDTERLRFRDVSGTSSTYRLSRYLDPVKSTWHIQLWRGDMSAEIDLDWGRYAILALSSRHVLSYVHESREVFVPMGAPLPILLARALGLCNGTYPGLVRCAYGDTIALCSSYKGVPPSIFEAVSSKVEECDI